MKSYPGNIGTLPGQACIHFAAYGDGSHATNISIYRREMYFTKEKEKPRLPTRAIDGARTRDPELGKLMLYQLSYYRMTGYAFSAAKVRNSANNRKHLHVFFDIFPKNVPSCIKKHYLCKGFGWETIHP